MKRLSYTRLSFAIAAFAIVSLGMLRDPDMSNADESGGHAVAHDQIPGYQCLTDNSQLASLTPAELATLNAPVDGVVPTF